MRVIPIYIYYTWYGSSEFAAVVFYDSIRLVFLFPMYRNRRGGDKSSRPQPGIFIYAYTYIVCGGHKNLSHRWKAISDEDTTLFIIWYLTDSCLIFTSFKRYIRAPSGRIVGVCNWSRCTFVHLSGFIHLYIIIYTYTITRVCIRQSYYSEE